jgi:hypothetical protein
MFKGNLWTRMPTILAGIFLVLVMVTTVLNFQNRSIQADVNQRQQFITQSAQLSQINQLLIRSLATASVKNAGIKQLLASVGLNVTYQPNTPSAPSSPTTTAPTGTPPTSTPVAPVKPTAPRK